VTVSLQAQSAGTMPDTALPHPQESETTLRPAGDLHTAMAPVARRYRRANNMFMRQINEFGHRFGAVYKRMPDATHRILEQVLADCLIHIYRAASATRPPGPVAGLDGVANTALIATAGAIGGSGGILTTLSELPLTIGIIFRGMQRVARRYGRDPDAATTKQICLSIFFSGDVITDSDDDANRFIGIRLLMQDQLLRSFVTRMAPALLMKFSPKLISPPVIGAATGSAINLIYIRHYETLAHVYFQLADLASEFGAEATINEFLRQTARRQPKTNRSRGFTRPSVWRKSSKL